MDDCRESIDGGSVSDDLGDEGGCSMELSEGDGKTGGSSSNSQQLALPSSSRVMRNLAEKMRRDKLNTHINELSMLVPMVAGSSKKLDKTSILRLSATYLRMNKTLRPDKNWSLLPKELEFINLSQYLMEDMEGFLIIITSGARIIFISHTVEKFLGHSQNELMGQSLYNICHEEDRDVLKKNLTPDEGFPNCCGPGASDRTSHGEDSSSSDTGTSSSSATSSPVPIDSTSSRCDSPPAPTPMDHQRRSFYLRFIQKASSRSDQPQYEHIHVIGDLRVPSKLELHTTHTRSRRQREHSFNENDIVLVAVGRMYKEPHVNDVSILEGRREEYITRHEPTGKMIYIDHRIAIVAGYMSEEVLGLSAFNFMHKDDVSWTMIALKQMFDKGLGYGCSTYRLKTRTGEYIYLRTCGYLEFNKETQTIGSFICVNTRISKEEGEQGIADMRRRFSPHVHKTKAIMSPEDVDVDVTVPATIATLALHGAVSDQKLKVAVKEMVSGLRSPASSSVSELSPVSPQTVSRSHCVVEMVSSSTETVGATRPTVLREVTSMYSVTSSTGGAGTRDVVREVSPARTLKRVCSEDLSSSPRRRWKVMRRRENGTTSSHHEEQEELEESEEHDEQDEHEQQQQQTHEAPPGELTRYTPDMFDNSESLNLDLSMQLDQPDSSPLEYSMSLSDPNLSAPQVEYPVSSWSDAHIAPPEHLLQIGTRMDVQTSPPKRMKTQKMKTTQQVQQEMELERSLRGMGKVGKVHQDIGVGNQ